VYIILTKGRIKTKILKYDIIFKERPHGKWSIVIPPNILQIDNYHHDVHIHPDKKPLSIKDPDKILDIIIKHIYKEESLNLEKLRNQLIF